MDAGFFVFARFHPLGEIAMHPLARLLPRLPWSRLLAGPGLRRRCFVVGTRSDPQAGASNCSF